MMIIAILIIAFTYSCLPKTVQKQQCLLNDKKRAQKFWSKELVHEITIRLSNLTVYSLM